MLKNLFILELRAVRKAREEKDWDKALESLSRCLDIIEASEKEREETQTNTSETSITQDETTKKENTCSQ